MRAALRAPLLRLAVFRPPRRGAFRALAEVRFAVRFLAPPRLRPEDPDRDLFLPLFERLDFLAAAMGLLRVGGFVERIARFAHNNSVTFHIACKHESRSHQGLSDYARLTMLHDPEVVACEPGCLPQLSHSCGWLVHRFVGELERSPVRGNHDKPTPALPRR